jgi:hypothetical protein
MNDVCAFSGPAVHRSAAIGSAMRRPYVPDSVMVRRGPRITSQIASMSSPMKVKVAVSVQGPGEHDAGGVDRVAQAVDGDQDCDELRDVAGFERQIADDQQAQTEQEEAGVPDIAECVDGPECLGVC